MSTHLTDEDRATLAIFFPGAVHDIEDMAYEPDLAATIETEGAHVAAFHVQEALASYPRDEIDVIAAVALVLLAQARRAAA